MSRNPATCNISTSLLYSEVDELDTMAKELDTKRAGISRALIRFALHAKEASPGLWEQYLRERVLTEEEIAAMLEDRSG